FELGAADSIRGRPLMIGAPPAVMRIRISYATNPDASGLQWLEPEQTASRLFPFLFTQSQAIHAPSWIPLQDTPPVRLTYSAVVQPARETLALMSAGNNLVARSDGPYAFYMEHPIPPYLIALAVGRLEFRKTGFRTGVYAEPSVVAAAANEFDATEE